MQLWATSGMMLYRSREQKDAVQHLLPRYSHLHVLRILRVCVCMSNSDSDSLTFMSENPVCMCICILMQVVETWARIEDDQEDFGIKLFMRLFKIAPKILRLFSFRGHEFSLLLTLPVIRYKFAEIPWKCTHVIRGEFMYA
jgi:hypothetical protein